jgi:hypothetical protein
MSGPLTPLTVPRRRSVDSPLLLCYNALWLVTQCGGYLLSPNKETHR